jgi:hypothetical protein
VKTDESTDLTYSRQFDYSGAEEQDVDCLLSIRDLLANIVDYAYQANVRLNECVVAEWS